MNADDRRFEVLRAIVADYVATHEPVGSKMLVDRHHLGVSQRHHPQRHGRAGGRGLHRAAAHLRRPDPHRQGLPAVRRPAVAGQAAVGGRAPGHPGVPRRRGRPRRRAAPQRAAARPADPAGRGRAVPDADPLHGAALSRSWRSRPRGCCWWSSPTPAGSSSGSSTSATSSPTTTWPRCGPLVNGALAGRPLAAASVAVAELPETAPAALRGVVTTRRVGAARHARRAPGGAAGARRHLAPSPRTRPTSPAPCAGCWRRSTSR